MFGAAFRAFALLFVLELFDELTCVVLCQELRVIMELMFPDELLLRLGERHVPLLGEQIGRLALGDVLFEQYPPKCNSQEVS